MNDVQIVDVLRLMATTGAKVAGPVLLAALAVGVIVSIFQTITQIQEQSVAFLLKLAAVVAVMVIGGPWMLGVLRGFFIEIWAKIPGVSYVFELNVSVTWALSLALATARTGAFVAACALVPRSMPKIVRGGFALALAFLIADPMPTLRIDTTDVVVYVAVNAFIGFALGWLVGLLTYVFDIAGSIVDFMAGTTAGAVFSHETGSSEGPVARFTSLAGHALLISLGGLTLVAQVLAASTSAVALDGQIGLSSVLGSIATARSTSLLRTGVELALPVGAVLFTLELGFGVLSRFVPQLNAFLVGLPVKLFTLFLVLGGFTVTFPAYADNVLAGAVTTARDVLGALAR